MGNNLKMNNNWITLLYSWSKHNLWINYISIFKKERKTITSVPTVQRTRHVSTHYLCSFPLGLESSPFCLFKFYSLLDPTHSQGNSVKPVCTSLIPCSFWTSLEYTLSIVHTYVNVSTGLYYAYVLLTLKQCAYLISPIRYSFL